MCKRSVVKAAVLGAGTACFFSVDQSAWSQTVTAAIVGTITDPAGAAVSGATITATSVERGTTYTAVTNDSGLYRIPVRTS